MGEGLSIPTLKGGVFRPSALPTEIKLLSDSGTINIASGDYLEDVIISKALVLKGYDNPTAGSIILNTPLGSGSGGITAPTVKVNSGGKIQDGVNLASATVNVGPGYYCENVLVDKSLSIKGSGESFTGVDGGQAGSVLSISSGKTATLSDMTIRNGRADYGGGIFSSGTLTVTDSTISSNSATSGGGIIKSFYATTPTIFADVKIYGNTPDDKNF